MQLPLIISATTLARQLENNPRKLLLLDIRTETEFRIAHIPCAVSFDKNTVNRSEGNVKGLLPDKEALATALAHSGFNGTQHLVIYNDTCTPDAGRVCWTLLAFGVRNVSLLNGGFAHWQASEYAVVQGEVKVEHTDFSSNNLQQPDDSIACNHQQIRANLHDTHTRILDVRSPSEYHGSDIRSQYGGHIPQAININWTLTKAENSTLFKQEAALQALFQSHDIHPKHRIIVYCHSHQRSALVAFILMHLGYQNVIGYPGAWSDWGNRDTTPKTLKN